MPRLTRSSLAAFLVVADVVMEATDVREVMEDTGEDSVSDLDVKIVEQKAKLTQENQEFYLQISK